MNDELRLTEVVYRASEVWRGVPSCRKQEDYISVGSVEPKTK